MFIQFIFDFTIIGIISSLLTILFTEYIKIDKILSTHYYSKIILEMHFSNNKYVSYLANYIGYNIYSTSLLFSFILFLIFCSNISFPYTRFLSIQMIIIGIILTESISFFSTCIYRKYIYKNHPDLDEFYEE